MANISPTQMSFMEDLRTCSKEEALKILATIRNMRTVVKEKKPKGAGGSTAVKKASSVSDTFLKTLQKDGLI